MVYYIVAVVLFLLMGYIIHRLAYKRFIKLNGRTPTRREIWSIYHWEGVLGISATEVIVLIYFLKTSNVLSL